MPLIVLSYCLVSIPISFLITTCASMIQDTHLQLFHDLSNDLSISFLSPPRKQFRNGHDDGAPAAVGALLCQLLQLDVQRCGQQDRGGGPGLPDEPLPAQQPADR